MNNIIEDLCTLKSELEQHNATLLSRPSLLLITKIDLLPEDLFLNKKINDMPQLAISSVSGYNINKSVQNIAEIIQSLSDPS